MQSFTKGLIALEGQGVIDIGGSLAFTLGIGLEYHKKSKKILPYILGTTGLDVGFSIETDTTFAVTIGPFGADVTIGVVVDDYGEDLSIQLGLEDKLRYYLPPADSSFVREGFVFVPSIGKLVDEVAVAFSGRVSGTAEAEFRGLPPGAKAEAFVQFDISDINNLINKKPGAISSFYQVKFEISIPSFLDILLMDPFSIIKAIDGVFETAEKYSLGRQGIVTKFSGPIIGPAIPKALKAGTNDHFLAQARRKVVGGMETAISQYVDDGGDSTVADLLAGILDEALGDGGIGILQKGKHITTTYYEHANGPCINDFELKIFNCTTGKNTYDDSKDVKSLMWTIPFGQNYTFSLPELDFEIGNDALPFQLTIESGDKPVLEVSSLTMILVLALFISLCGTNTVFIPS